MTPAPLGARLMPPLPVRVDHNMCGDSRDDGEHQLVDLTMATCLPPSLAQTAPGRGTHQDVRGFAASGAQEVSRWSSRPPRDSRRNHTVDTGHLQTTGIMRQSIGVVCPTF